MKSTQLHAMPTSAVPMKDDAESSLQPVDSHMVNAQGLREPDMTYTLPQALFSRDYLFMYITLAGNRCVFFSL